MRRLLQPCCWIFFLKITISVLHYVVCFPGEWKARGMWDGGGGEGRGRRGSPGTSAQPSRPGSFLGRVGDRGPRGVQLGSFLIPEEGVWGLWRGSRLLKIALDALPSGKLGSWRRQAGTLFGLGDSGVSPVGGSKLGGKPPPTPHSNLCNFCPLHTHLLCPPPPKPCSTPLSFVAVEESRASLLLY